MPKKRTQPYGFIDFAKDGKVAKHMFQLSGDKPVLEMEIATAFAEAFASAGHVDAEVKPLAENDHDFLLIRNGEEIEVQLTEAAVREYTTKISKEDYIEGRVSGDTFVPQSDGSYLVVDHGRLNNIFVSKIDAKKKKHYQKPARPLWLCIWSTDALMLSFYYDDSKPTKSPALIAAEAYCATTGVGPFARIWHFGMLTKPYQIWPALPLP